VRLFLALPLVTVTACSINSDATNEQVTLDYNKQVIRETAEKAGRTAKNLASSVGNVAGATGRAIRNEVGDVDVNVDVKRTRPNQDQARQDQAPQRPQRP
jgi:hypothetical protein